MWDSKEKGSKYFIKTLMKKRPVRLMEKIEYLKKSFLKESDDENSKKTTKMTHFLLDPSKASQPLKTSQLKIT